MNPWLSLRLWPSSESKALWEVIIWTETFSRQVPSCVNPMLCFFLSVCLETNQPTDFFVPHPALNKVWGEICQFSLFLTPRVRCSPEAFCSRSLVYNLLSIREDERIMGCFSSAIVCLVDSWQRGSGWMTENRCCEGSNQISAQLMQKIWERLSARTVQREAREGEMCQEQ